MHLSALKKWKYSDATHLIDTLPNLKSAVYSATDHINSPQLDMSVMHEAMPKFS